MLRQLLNNQVLRASVGSSFIKVGSIGIAFLASLLYARILGPHNYGLYAFVIAWTTILAVPASLGLPQYLIREGAKAPDQFATLRRWSSQRVFIAGSIVAVALIITSLFSDKEIGPILFAASPIPLLTNLSAVRQSLLQAQGWIVRSQWPTQLALPAVTLIALMVIYLIHGPINALDLVLVTAAATALPLYINASQLRSAIHAQPSTTEIARPSVVATLPFMLLTGLYLLNNRVDLLFLGTLRSPSEVGFYAISSRIAELTLIFSNTTNTALAPQIAKMHTAGEQLKLQVLISRATRGYLIMTAPIAITFVLAAPYILPALYGEPYAQGVPVLQLLTLGQFVIVALGSVGTTLMMTGHEKLCMIGVAAGVLTNLILNIALTPTYGAIGAALSTIVSTSFTQVILWYWVRTRLQLKTSGLGF